MPRTAQAECNEAGVVRAAARETAAARTTSVRFASLQPRENCLSGFDPYLIWLDIPPHERPVNHYRLLGLRPLESDGQAISAAAERVIAHVSQFLNTAQAAACHQLLAEIHAARACLLDPLRKSAYDSGMAMGSAERAIPGPAAPVGHERQIAHTPPVPTAPQATAPQATLPPSPLPQPSMPTTPSVQPLPGPGGPPRSVQSVPQSPATVPTSGPEVPLPPAASPQAAVPVRPHSPQPQQPPADAPPTWAAAERTGQVGTAATAPAEPQGISTQRTSRSRLLRRQQQNQSAYLLVAFAIAMIVFFFGAVLLLAIYLNAG